ncbi:hypothetical protein [Pantoea ananatis]|uniref:hypothetical protein n=1 Tax=Pantoea ananas TaxID=553 RepID=UPI00351D4FAB
MSHLLNDPKARNWVDAALKRHSISIYGRFEPAVIWTNDKDINGQLIVPVDPQDLSKRINRDPFIMLHNHDPGNPKGQILESAVFETLSGIVFVAAVVGFYAGGNVLKFSDLNFNLEISYPSPKHIPDLPDNAQIELALDPREVDSKWIESVTANAPIRIKHTEFSYNAAEITQELISIGIGYLAIVWNPFVTAVASEAGKRTYQALHDWMKKFLSSMSDRKNPIINIISWQDGCQVSFLLRGKNVKLHYMAHDALSEGGVQAAELIRKIKIRGNPPTQLTYEWDNEANKWFPSYALLADKSIIVHKSILIAMERMPTNLSLGISVGTENNKMILPSNVKKKD